MVDGDQVTVLFHVDDLLVTCQTDANVDAIEKLLKEKFAAITINRSNKHSYLTINMVIDDEGIHLDMKAYLEKALGDRKIGRKTYSAATEDLFEVPESGMPLSVQMAKDFHYDVAKLLYLAKRTR
jgi:hypothetical protein